MKKRSAGKMQDVQFRNIDDFLAYLTYDDLRITERLRHIIMDCMPDCEERLAYNVPFYRLHANVCFLWPGSVPWGKVTRTGVRLGFTKGYLIEDEDNFLDKGDRKQVAYRDYYSVRDIDAEMLRSYLIQAMLLDEEAARAKSATKRSKQKDLSKDC